jgi:hypothetical protein
MNILILTLVILFYIFNSYLILPSLVVIGLYSFWREL